MTQAVPHVLLAQLSDLIAARLGLHFPKARWRALERGIRAVARELEFSDVAACIRWLVSTPLTQQHIAVLATHLTIGETYFFRDPLLFRTLEEEILPALIRARQGNTRRLRFWSAGCATGEEPYSIAISISKVIPDRQDWDITLLATDINPRFQQTALAGVYRAWSFRETPLRANAPYFSSRAGGHAAVPSAIRKMVTFAYLNLVDDVYPSPLTNTVGMDVIFCRNVLMYMAPEQAKRVIHRLSQALADGGWLIVSPSEVSHTLFASFQMIASSGAILYRKTSHSPGPVTNGNAPAPPRHAVTRHPPGLGVPDQTPHPMPPAPGPYGDALTLYQQGRYAEVAETIGKSCADGNADAPALALLARTRANQGRLAQARRWCEQAIVADRLNAGLHYLYATILQEQGALDDAAVELRRALYLDQYFVLAYLALGSLALQRGARDEARKHFETMRTLLGTYQPEEILPESGGITAGRLRAIIASMYPGPPTR